jgi:RNA polymerase sigma-70 factor (ECF subfamily)
VTIVDPSLIESVDPARSSSFDDTFEATFPELVRILTVISGDRATARSDATDAFGRAFARWRRISRRDDPATWIRRLALRRARRAAGAGPRRATTNDPLLIAVAALPFDQRAVVALHEAGELEPAGIAPILGLSEATIRSQIDEARAHLRAAWDPGDEAFDHVVRSYLHHAVPGPIDPSGDLVELRPRFVRAQRRRTAMVGVVAAAIVTVVVLVASVRGEQPGGAPRAVASRADVATTTAPAPSSSPSPNPPLPRVPWAAPNNVVAPPDGAPEVASAAPSTPVSPTAREVPLTAPGGIVVVRVDGSNVALVTATPAPGWAVAETRTDGGRVGVRFSSDATPAVSKVVARVEDGQFIGQAG